MYLFVGFFNDNEIIQKRKFISEKSVQAIKSIFNNYLELNDSELKGAIGFFKGKENMDKPSFIIDIKNIEASEKNIIIEFNDITELPITSSEISKAIFKFSRRFNWYDIDTGYYPLLLLVNKQVFNAVRKGTPNLLKVSSRAEKVSQLKSMNEWEQICNLYEPLEMISNDPDLWENPLELYDLGFACSKLGEPKNGMERDKSHLEYIKKYREKGLEIYKRCHELEPWSYRYASSIAYRHYQNVSELTKPKGRRDGNAKAEIEQALNWFNISLGLYPSYIKDNYRKGKLIVDKQLKNVRYSGNELSKESFREINILIKEAIDCLKMAIGTYEEELDETKKHYIKNEYIKSLYTLGKFYCDEIQLNWNDFICNKIVSRSFTCDFYNLNYLVEGKDLLEKCFFMITKIPIDAEWDISYLAKISKNPIVSTIDVLYSLGCIYYKMYYIKLIKNNNDNIEEIKKKAEYYFVKSLELRKEFHQQRISFRNTTYINNNLACLYILTENYSKAIDLTRNVKDGYIKNTYATALILTGDAKKLLEAKDVLETAYTDKFNLAKPLTTVLLAKVYQLANCERELSKLMAADNTGLKSTKKLLEIIL